MVFVVSDKIIHGAVRMCFLPLRVQVVYIHSACAATKDTEKCMVRHMSGDATQCRTFETTLCIGGLNSQQTSRPANQQQTSHRTIPLLFRKHRISLLRKCRPV